MSTKSQSASRDCNIYGSEANANFCDSCKLDCLKKAKKAKAKPVADEDDYSISEELTGNGNRMNILYLFIAAVAVFGLVVLFSVLFSCFAV